MIRQIESVLEKPLTEVPIKTKDVSFPASVQTFVDGALVFDCSSSLSSKTYKFSKQAGNIFCKVGPRELLDREVRMNKFFSSHGIGPYVLHYLDLADQGYLVTAALAGTDGISPENLQSPDKLAYTFGKSLARIHSLPAHGCPFSNRNDEMLDQALINLEKGEFAEYLIPEGLQLGKEKFFRLRSLSTSDTVIHGDYCLPNIILKDNELVGFLDLGNGGYGDSHHDLFWGLWTLEYNLKTDKFNEVFLNAYGRDRVDFERIEFNRLLSGFMD